ncbi:MAG: Lrp/AsnC family transcriptional regulator [Thermoplasmatota archaeon]
MAKSSQKKINEDEQKVITALEENANESIGGIAKKCRFSRQKAWRIIKRLEKNKTIWGYHARVTDSKMNRTGYILLYKLNNLQINKDIEDLITNEKLNSIAKELHITIEDNLWLHGVYDCMVSFYAQNILKAKQFQQAFLGSCNGAIGDNQLLEQIVIIKKDGFQNPHLKETKKLL